MDALKKSSSHHAKPPPYQNGCYPKNFSLDHPCGYKWLVHPQPAARAFAFPSVFIRILWSQMT